MQVEGLRLQQLDALAARDGGELGRYRVKRVPSKKDKATREVGCCFFFWGGGEGEGQVSPLWSKGKPFVRRPYHILPSLRVSFVSSLARLLKSLW